jgi:hypothetical protein
MQTRITSIGKRIPLKLSMSIRPGFGTAVYPTGPPAFANATEPVLDSVSVPLTLLAKDILRHCSRMLDPNAAVR